MSEYSEHREHSFRLRKNKKIIYINNKIKNFKIELAGCSSLCSFNSPCSLNSYIETEKTEEAIKTTEEQQ